MTLDIKTYEPKGDKHNSTFFDEYRLKIYDRRKSAGIEDLLGTLRALVIQVDTGDALPYLEELSLMSAYRFTAAYVSETHKIFVLTSKPEYPRLFVLEPLSRTFEDDLTRLNYLYPLARPKPNARYVGEVFHTDDRDETRKVLESHNVRFDYPGDTENKFYTDGPFLFTIPSDFTENRVGYTSADLNDHAALGLGQPLSLTAEQQAALDAKAALAKENRLDELILGVDHMATRILAGEREDAILEFLSMSNYYFWGAYNISEMNSSTNVNRNHHVKDDKLSPAKVFTANNTPSFINSFENLPMPTEDFVRNYGRRMHHIAYEVVDGNHKEGEKNVDYVVGKLAELGTAFLAHVVGECKDDPNLKQIFSKHSQYSILITEYVERCYGYEGFFTKSNVAALTAAAGQDEQYKHGQVFD